VNVLATKLHFSCDTGTAKDYSFSHRIALLRRATITALGTINIALYGVENC